MKVEKTFRIFLIGIIFFVLIINVATQIFQQIPSLRKFNEKKSSMREEFVDKGSIKCTSRKNLKQNKNSKNLYNFQKIMNLMEDTSRMISIIGSYEDSLSNESEELGDDKKVEMYSGKEANDINVKRILDSINNKLEIISQNGGKKPVPINHLAVNLPLDENKYESTMQTVQVFKNMQRIVNPHLDVKKTIVF